MNLDLLRDLCETPGVPGHAKADHRVREGRAERVCYGTDAACDPVCDGRDNQGLRPFLDNVSLR